MPFNINKQKAKKIINVENLNVNSLNNDSEKLKSSDFTQNVKNLISQGYIDEAISKMDNNFKNNKSYNRQLNELTMIAARHSAISNKEIHELETHENINVEKAKINGSGVNPLIHSFQSPILKGLQATIHIFDPLPNK